MVFLRGCALMALWFVMLVCALGAVVAVVNAEASAIVFGIIAFACWAGIERLTAKLPA